MGRRVSKTIQESLSTLKSLRRKQTSLQKEKRIYALICLKENRFGTRQELANHLGTHIRSLEKWLVQYDTNGIEDLVKIKPKRKGSRIITAQIHEGLRQSVNDAKKPFMGYWDAKHWVKEQYEVEVSYHRIREYLIKHFKTKVKRPRKSHIQKDPQAEEAFFKTSKHIRGA
jgi:transposase